jgi:hypothetical protein
MQRVWPEDELVARWSWADVFGKSKKGRQAYNLGYACQRENRFGRLQRRAAMLNRGLGGEGWATWSDPPPKPKWMRWRTYEKKIPTLGASDRESKRRVHDPSDANFEPAACIDAGPPVKVVAPVCPEKKFR